mmetsp:Transcript_6002/g.8742  ORF Transcript_6002/g.8742 Transcript_6002/m.8742 type:complete len:323 (+) Transcript_6002:62-1030(+)
MKEEYQKNNHNTQKTNDNKEGKENDKKKENEPENKQEIDMDEIVKLRNENTKLIDEIKSLKKMNSKLQSRQDKLKKENKKLINKIETLHEIKEYDPAYDFEVIECLNEHIVNLLKEIKGNYFDHMKNYKSTGKNQGYYNHQKFTEDMFHYCAPSIEFNRGSIYTYLTEISTPEIQVDSFHRNYQTVFEVTNHQWKKNEYDLQPLIEAFKLLDYTQEINKTRINQLKSLCGDLEKKLVDLHDFWNFPYEEQFTKFMNSFGCRASISSLNHEKKYSQYSLGKPFSLFNLKFVFNPKNKDQQNELLNSMMIIINQAKQNYIESAS